MTLSEREAELRDALETARRSEGHDLAALMVTDIVSRGTRLLVAGEPRAARADPRRRSRRRRPSTCPAS